MPLALSPSTTDYRYGVPPIPSITPSSPAAFTTSSGTLLTSVSPRVVYTPGTLVSLVHLEVTNRTRSIVVVGTNASAEVDDVAIQVTAVLNEISVDGFWGDWGFKEKGKEPAVVSVGADGLTQKVRYKGATVPSWELTPTDRDLVDWAEVKAFRAHHRLHLPFYIIQPVTEEEVKVVFDQLEYESAFDSHTSISTALLVKKYGGT
jgi:hypothetical protein